jgi:NAD(P)-dependent dehydrogenase (short-subunit alcohol dehydrogenase family)
MQDRMSTRAPLALVTGASRGFGYACARAAAARGFHVVAVARTVGGLEELDDAIRAAGGAATLVPLDLTDEPAHGRLAEAIAGRWGALDLWIHAAAFAPALSPVAHADAKDLDRAFALNARATHRLIAALDPLLRAAPAGVALLPDDRREGAAYWSAYAASKAAARAFWTAWAAETRATSRLRPALILPPPMPTALRARFFPGENRARLAEPDAVARALFDALAAPAREPGAPIDLRALAAEPG